MVDFISSTSGSVRLPGILTLGYIASFNDILAMGIIKAKGVKPLKEALINEKDHNLKSAAAWTLG